MSGAAIYARISLDRRDGEGVGRQVADCRQLAAERGLVVVGEFIDNDVSAYRARRRPEFDRLLKALDTGEVGTVLAYHPDRIYRRLADLERFADAVDRAGAEVLTVKAGDLDLSTGTGLMLAGILGAVAHGEVKRIGERVARAKRERAAQGRPPGGGLRPFGYEPDKITVLEPEARLIRDAAERVAAGESLWQIAREWNAAGVTTTAGNPWEVSAVRRVLLSPRIAGLRAYRGTVVGEAVWPAIIDRGTHDLLVAAAAPRRRGRPRDPRWLLSGLIACPRCGGAMYGWEARGQRAYKCMPSPVAGRGCGGASVAADPADEAARAFVLRVLEREAGRVSRRASKAAPKGAGEAERIAERRRAIAARWGAGEITDEQFDAAQAELARREQALAAQPVERPRFTDREVLALVREGTVEQWRRAVELVVETPIPLAPGRAADPGDRLVLRERA